MKTNGESARAAPCIFLSEPPSVARRERIEALLALDAEIVVLDDVGQALRRQEIPSALVFVPEERRLALRSALRALQTKNASLEIFVLGGTKERISVLASELEICPCHLEDTRPHETAKRVAEVLGIRTEKPKTLVRVKPDRCVWTSPRGSLETWVCTDENGARMAWTRTAKRDWDELSREKLVAAVNDIAAIQSPHLPPLESVDDGADGVAFFHRIGEGRSLLDITAHQTMPIADAEPIFGGLASMLDAVHSSRATLRGLGPIEPGQVWLVDDDRPVFLAAGASLVAHRFDRALRGRELMAMAMRQSPEELAGSPLDPRADTFYAASFLFELLAGSEPFPKLDPREYVHAIRDGAARDLRLYLPKARPELAERLAACLAAEPRARPSIAALRDALVEAARSRKTGDLPAASASAPRVSAKKPWWRFW